MPDWVNPSGMNPLSPADTSIPISVESQDGPGSDVSIRVGSDVGPFAFIIRTIERTGQRMNAAGHVTGVVDDARTIAALAIRESRLAALHETYPREKIAEQADPVDWSEWEFAQIEVDGVGFALRVRQQQSPGFVAIADLGAAVVTMRGKDLPADRRFTLKRSIAESAPPDASTDGADK